jgi:hypothetical protein
MTRSSSSLGLILLTSLGLAAGACQQKGGPINVERVEPDQGIVTGGDSVVIQGSGFEPGKTQVEVRFGRQRAEQVSIASNGKINVITPPGDRGPVDVTLMFNDGAQFKIPGGFRYMAGNAGSDVRKAFFSGKPGEAKPAATTPTNTAPPAPAK